MCPILHKEKSDGFLCFGFVLFVALLCYGGASVSAKGFVTLQSFTGEHSNHMSLLHLSTS